MTRVLTPLDRVFLHLESPRTPMHMGSIGIFEGGPWRHEDGTLRIDEARDRIDARLPLVPKLRRRVSRSPLWLLSPVWEDDPGFDVRRHVRQAALPPPGDETQLLEVCAEILSWPLAPERPLWELWFVEGLQGGRVAILQKLHHAMADGLAGVELATVLLDLQRHPRPKRRDGPAWQARRRPHLTEVAAHDLGALADRTGRRLRDTASALRRPDRVVGDVAAAVDGLASLFGRDAVAPRCSLNTPIGRRRRVAVVRARLAAIRAVERWRSVTLNDVLLSAVAGGVRDLHLARGEALHDLQVMVPVGYGHDGGHGLGNNVSTMVVRLPLDEADPGELLARVASAMAGCKRHHQARGAAAMLGTLGAGLEPGLGAVAGLVQHQPFVNVVVTNVPGPSASLYAMGSRMLEAFPIVPLARNLSLGVAALSYHGQLGVGLYADRAACPDLGVVAEGMARTFDALAHRAHAATRVTPGGLPLPAAAAGARAS